MKLLYLVSTYPILGGSFKNAEFTTALALVTKSMDAAAR